MPQCGAIFKRSETSRHLELECTKLEMPCKKCEMTVGLREMGQHDCIRDMRAKMEKQEKHIEAITSFVFQLAQKFN